MPSSVSIFLLPTLVRESARPNPGTDPVDEFVVSVRRISVLAHRLQERAEDLDVVRRDLGSIQICAHLLAECVKLTKEFKRATGPLELPQKLKEKLLVQWNVAQAVERTAKDLAKDEEHRVWLLMKAKRNITDVNVSTSLCVKHADQASVEVANEDYRQAYWSAHASCKYGLQVPSWFGYKAIDKQLEDSVQRLSAFI